MLSVVIVVVLFSSMTLITKFVHDHCGFECFLFSALAPCEKSKRDIDP